MRTCAKNLNFDWIRISLIDKLHFRLSNDREIFVENYFSKKKPHLKSNKQFFFSSFKRVLLKMAHIWEQKKCFKVLKLLLEKWEIIFQQDFFYSFSNILAVFFFYEHSSISISGHLFFFCWIVSTRNSLKISSNIKKKLDVIISIVEYFFYIFAEYYFLSIKKPLSQWHNFLLNGIATLYSLKCKSMTL